MNIAVVAPSLIMSFLCGSIPSGYLIVKKFKEIDIRVTGSGNIGSTNVRRAAGKKLSAITQAMDVAKGLLPVLISMIIFKSFDVDMEKSYFIALNAFFAILGHDYTPFLNFNGGKGVNTTLGAFLAIEPISVFSGLVVYFALRPVTSIVSIRSMALGAVIAVVTFLKGAPQGSVIFTALAAVLIIWRHKENIKRLVKGHEK
ncbi:glycerol-3-phosphate acyltransferase PlsY [Peptoclostridium litorale DSM 5388]|uniref:Glycerol-3-phosphate acyltransferase n=1 Tax=Peptoclostridium litorale DSM 5388 TaxID=1121324 RepID=A0A069RC24_PEPLI|nr:glycerol-3-phosphate 1-O-acyltransferase PlsY [Peptoclostridium litorale]KDR94333.1 glycerol-3-phosphate acyltransferase PlsY [Peptoclostridium litorale DSM 5388]SIO29162.1 glycerol-3-phosphate acyltransferase PlsY [Peptoclostridium litorale DSM 5388]